MPLVAIDHANVRTANLDAMVAFYTDVLGFRLGERPEFGFPGAWLYLGDQACIHLVGVENAPRTTGNLGLEHIAFRASGYAQFLADLERRGIPYRLARVPGMPIVQVNLHDPDGNHLHIDFDTAEADG